MKMYRVKAIILRHLILTFRDFHRFIDLIYWPLLEIIIWGFTARWFQSSQNQSEVSLILLTALVFWQVILRAQFEISLSFLDELWSHNLVNLFSTPITLSEWITAVTLVGIVKCLFTFIFGALVIWLFYSLIIVLPFFTLLIYIFLLIGSGLAIGFLTTAAIAYWGQKIQTLAWVMGWFFAPFSGVFYPISVLPFWAQYMAAVLPMSYLFEGMRETVITGTINKHLLLYCFTLNIIYLVIALFLFKIAFEKSKSYGLARLERYE
jgi:ABC-2 type transport system permease protein